MLISAGLSSLSLLTVQGRTKAKWGPMRPLTSHSWTDEQFTIEYQTWDTFTIKKNQVAFLIWSTRKPPKYRMFLLWTALDALTFMRLSLVGLILISQNLLPYSNVFKALLWAQFISEWSRTEYEVQVVGWGSPWKQVGTERGWMNSRFSNRDKTEVNALIDFICKPGHHRPITWARKSGSIPSFNVIESLNV